MTPKNDIIYDVVGIGNAIVDVLAKVGDGFLTERRLDKGAMTLLQAAEAGTIYADLIPEREVSGGSAANTVAAIASLGGTPAFIGKVHDDELGQEFQRSIGAAGVDFFTKPLLQGPSTGRSIVLVTPDAERSMFTYLGAAQKLSADDVDENIIKSSKIIYLEGYIWDSESAREAMLDQITDRKEEVIEAAEVLIKYQGYIDRERMIADKIHRLEAIRIKGKFDYNSLNSLSTEARQKLMKIDPETLAQASRIPGISPSDINVLLVLLGR